MTYEEIMAAARQADAAGDANVGRSLREIAQALPDRQQGSAAPAGAAGQAAPSAGPWTKYGQPTGQAATGPWTKYAQGAAAQPASPAGNQRQPNFFDQFDEPAAPAAPTPGAPR